MQTGKGKTGSSHMARVAVSAFVAVGFLLVSFASLAEEIESNIARGGKLYDEWYEIADGDLPSGTHPSYPKEGKKSKNTTWRCQECHGWDYMGKDGAYAKGSHYTGLAGIRASAGADPAAIVAILKSDSHRFSEDNFSDEDFEDISLFVAKGQVEMDKYIDRASMAVKGDKAQGEAYYNTVCAGCHGRNGKQIKDMKAVSAVANGDLWQTLHKILNGQPGEKMPAMRAFPVQVTVDILAYIQTLPE
ncbi:MAG: c-type cytochrome [Pseudomonadales bacterium]|nr:c-type cytochrome [Pseudomonadales bacterium]MDP7594027.1 c-type cytochrome [Pseudomonadales bacterium]HJN53336.1 c-type cytochrome [Pseudomonadales bacterium]